jgi:hypothetical protein
MRTTPCTWFDTKGGGIKHGFMVRVDGKWMHAAENGKPCIYETEKERDKKRAQFRKMKTQPQLSGD